MTFDVSIRRVGEAAIRTWRFVAPSPRRAAVFANDKAKREMCEIKIVGIKKV